MIEKLKKQNTWGECLEKLNEVVDAVNKLETMAKNTNTVLESLVEENNIHEKQIDKLQMKVEPEKCKTPADNSGKANCQENVQDKFAEQRNWVGCLCRFRHGLGVTPTYGILGNISPNSVFPYYKKDTDTYWKYCEPVKPDDDIIYKGGDNE